jgi:hypothetical protein
VKEGMIRYIMLTLGTNSTLWTTEGWGGVSGGIPHRGYGLLK